MKKMAMKGGVKKSGHPKDKFVIHSIGKDKDGKASMPMKGEVRNRKEKNTVSKGNEKPAKVGGKSKKK